MDALLSPNEENALRRVAHGSALAVDLPSRDRERLQLLGLVKIRSADVKLTAKGKLRYERLPHRAG